MERGRPSKYTPELIEAAWAYIDGGWDDGVDVIPSVAGMAVEIGVRRETCHVWANDETKEFSNIISALMEKQERVLANMGLKGSFNSTITKLLLTKHNYSDRVEQDNTSSDGTMSPNVVERVIVMPDVSKD